MAKKRPQKRNPYVRFGPKAQGPYAQNLGGGAYGRSLVLGAEEECFFVTSLTVGGDPNPDTIVICFNKNWSNCVNGWSFEKNGLPYQQAQVPIGVGQPCIGFEVYDSFEDPGNGPDDVITASYTPGNCQASGESDCLLEGFADRVVTNNIWGPTGARIGDLGDDILIVVFPTAPAVIGNRWRVFVNGPERSIDYGSPDTKVEANTIQLKLTSPVSDLDTVTVTHSPPVGNFTNAAQAADGRYCWRFYDYPVTVTLGVSYWMQQGGDRWLVEGTSGPGRWRLE